MFFKLNAYYQRRYKYISTDLAFEKFDFRICPTCGREIAVGTKSNSPEPLMELEGPKKYPDILEFCGVGVIPYPFIISKRAIDLFEENHVTGFKRGKKVKFSNCPEDQEYYYAEIIGRIDLHLKSMQLKKKRICKECGKYDWSRKSLGKYILDRDSWSETDLCRLTSLPGIFICTEKVIDLIKAHKLTGFEFASLNEADGLQTNL